ncbi:MAG TPA: FAD/NAD(P)-binding oxidoreductase [bacterium]|jgi:sulfide:quinone oxidoreductase
MKRLLILGAGTGGTMIANKMRRLLRHSDWSITIIDRSPRHLYQPGLIFIPFRLYGYTGERGNVRPTRDFIPRGVDLVEEEVTRIDPDHRQVATKSRVFDYDRLVMALGCRIAPSEIPGMEEGYGKNVFYFYTLPAALDLQGALADFNGGKLVLNIAEYPIKCPVAPIEFACLAHYYFKLRGIRNRVEIEVVTGMESIFTKPICADIMGTMLRSRDINIVPNFSLAEVDSEHGVITSYAGQKVRFDLLAAIPPNVGPAVIDEAGLGDGNGYAVTDPNTLKAKRADDIYVLGDCTNVATSKAGSVAHFEAGVVAKNLWREIAGKRPYPGFDGHSNCFIETGYNKAHLIDFNYVQQPIPGKLPFPVLGPFSLLKETQINHWGKLSFRWYYWNILLKDRFSKEMEYFLPTRMSLRGKDRHYLREATP